eukprot:scaffold10242_cov88-Isochrysis_galbana.AAC.1
MAAESILDFARGLRVRECERVRACAAKARARKGGLRKGPRRRFSVLFLTSPCGRAVSSGLF